ncbi:MAG: formate/nitrite transporter family protein [Lachnospiraceae bacterium]|jgi:formate/nitrite family of transporters|nr:formate/nitrite transporter family protein [Acutalibacteraceae bacterium]
MENSFYTPSEVIKSNIKSAVAKANLPLAKMILLGMMAGAFIAFGGAASSVAAHGVADVGLARSIAGAIFPVGLMLVVFTGSELFTGNSLMIMAVIDKKITLLKMIRNLVVVYFANFIGALIIDVLVFLSGQFDFSGGGLGAYTIKVALAKTSIAPVTAVISGILCNILVCLAIVLAGTAKDSIGRIFGIFFPIAAFVVCGFEHCVANMFYIPAGMLAATNTAYVQKAQELYGITAQQCSSLTHFAGTESLLFVTIGNIIGGVLFVGVVLYMAHIKLSGKKS